jgi:TRAP-type C4-dicarboxylate transport system permease small subunit
MSFMFSLARAFALVGGACMGFIALMTCYSIVGRELWGSAVLGDFELSGVATGAAIALFMPWCQVRRGHIIVDFFTTRCSVKTIAVLDRVGAFLLSLCFALLAWRTAQGGVSAYTVQSGTMILGFPEWLVFACMAPAFVLTSLIAFMQSCFGFDHDGQVPA